MKVQSLLIVYILALLFAPGTVVAENITLTDTKVATEVYSLDVIEKQNQVTSKVFCPCGCGEILIDCHCDTALSVKDDIARRISEGSSPEQVLSYLIALYGTSILVDEDVAKIRKSGEKSGKNLVPLYIAAASIFGIVGYYYGRSRQGGSEYRYEEKVERELKKKTKVSKPKKRSSGHDSTKKKSTKRRGTRKRK